MRPTLVALLVALLVLLAARARAGAADVRKGPYLQHLGPASVDIRVVLSGSAPITVVVAKDALPGASPPTVIASPAASFHSVHVAGLTPATRYRYTVQTGAGATKEATFVTAPDGASHAPFRFIVYGDSRSDGPAHELVVAAIAKESFDFLIQTGDIVMAGDDEEAWQSFFDIEEPILASHPVFACIGNHELHNDQVAAHFERYFGPAEPAAAGGAPPPVYGSFRWGRARFFLLNAFESWASGPERTWLDGALAAADHEAGVDLRVAVLHHGPYSAGPHGNNRELLARHIDDLLVAHHVDLVLSGHDHIYERGEAGALKYLVTGGAGAPLYRELKPSPSTRKVEATHHYVVATVTDDGVAIVAKRPDGSVVDQCSFPFGGAWACDPKPPTPAPAAAERDRIQAPVTPPPVPLCACYAPGAPAGDALAGLAALGLASLAALRLRSRAR